MKRRNILKFLLAAIANPLLLVEAAHAVTSSKQALRLWDKDTVVYGPQHARVTITNTEGTTRLDDVGGEHITYALGAKIEDNISDKELTDTFERTLLNLCYSKGCEKPEGRAIGPRDVTVSWRMKPFIEMDLDTPTPKKKITARLTVRYTQSTKRA